MGIDDPSQDSASAIQMMKGGTVLEPPFISGDETKARTCVLFSFMLDSEMPKEATWNIKN